jgi:hypothetical protein
MTNRRSARRIAVIVVVLLVAAGCGVPSQDSATETDPNQVPFGLLDRNRGVEVGSLGGRNVVVFLTGDGRLVRTTRRIRPPLRLDGVLEVLKEGPTRAELAAGTRSAVLDDDTFESVAVAGGTAVVDLSRPFTGRSNADQILALAQIVFTLTARPGIGQVQFTLADQSIEIPVANGTLTTNPVSRDDYQSLAPADSRGPRA